MNTLAHINNMGISPMSDIERKTLKQFIENNPYLAKGMSESDIYRAYKNSLSFVTTRLGVAFSGFGYAIKKELLIK